MKIRLVMVGVLLIFVPGWCQADNHLGDNNYFTLRSVRYIQRRYYLIRRLEESITALNMPVHQGGIPLKSCVVDVFRNPVVKSAASAMIALQTTEPFCKVWSDFLAYRHLESDLFEREAMLLLLMIYKYKLLLLHDNSGYDIALLIQEIDNYIRVPEDDPFLSGTHTHEALTDSHVHKTLEHYDPELEAILFAGHHAPPPPCNGLVCHTVHENIKTLMVLLDESEDCNTSDGMIVGNGMRFYHIQRFLRPIFMLAKHESRFAFSTGSLNGSYTHSSIRQCVNDIEKSRDLKPLFQLWTSFVSYDYMNDALFISEFTQLIITIYAHALQESTKHAATGNFLQLYEAIIALPIPELLDFMDDLVDQFAASITEYELSNPALSWGAWLKKYWWAPPAFVGSLFVTMIKHGSIFKQLLDFFQKNHCPVNENS